MIPGSGGDLPAALLSLSMALYFGALLGGLATVTGPRLASLQWRLGKAPRFMDGIRAISYPPSSCACQRPLKAWEKAPLLGYLLTRGHCPACGSGIPRIYPLTEIAATAFFLLHALPAIMAVHAGSYPLTDFGLKIVTPGFLCGLALLAIPCWPGPAGLALGLTAIPTLYLQAILPDYFGLTGFLASAAALFMAIVSATSLQRIHLEKQRHE